jgi:6-phosphogluconolactonase
VPRVRTFADLDALSTAAADELAEIAREAIATRGECSIALSGGSTPKRLFQLLAARGRDALPWDQIELWWGDERSVPPDHADSNYRMAREALIEPLRIDPARVHRMQGEVKNLDAAARAYETELVERYGSPPVLDYMMLGMGSDGHTASLFPKSPGVVEREHFVIANPVDSPLAKGKTTRLTMTAPALCAARHIRFLVAGADKAAALAAVLEGQRDANRYPSQLVDGADVVWLVDTSAAAQLQSVRAR